MEWLYQDYEVILLLSAAAAVAIAAVASRHREEPGAVAFACLMIAAAAWCLTYMGELATPGLAGKLLFARLEFIGILIVPAAWLLSALDFTGHRAWLGRYGALWLIPVPAVTFLLILTNAWHGWFWSSAALAPEGRWVLLSVTHGPAFWVHTAYSYTLNWAGTLLLIVAIIRAWRQYRRLALTLLLGSLTPFIGSLIYLSGRSPLGHLDLTPFAYVLAGFIFSWTVFRLRLWDLTPLARAAVFVSLTDAVMVLDQHYRIADANPAACRLIGVPPALIIGRPVRQVLAAHADLLDEFANANDAHTEITVPDEGKTHSFDLRISPLRDRLGHQNGRLITLRDITERLHVEQALRQSEERYRVINAELEQRVAERTRQLEEAVRELRSQVAERRQAEEALRVSLAEKEVMLKEINHRVKNNLQVISSMLSLQGQAVDPEGVGAPALDVLRESQNRVRTMALIHERLYRSEDLAHIDFAEYVHNLSWFLFRSYGASAARVGLRIEGGGVRLGLDRAVPCGLIVNELISNSLKYAFPGERTGEILVTVAPHGTGGLELTVRDDGVGFPSDLDYRAADSLGLKLVTALVEQLDARLELTREVGVCWRLVF
jgi:PAS domain S-box-containing protein